MTNYNLPLMPAADSDSMKTILNNLVTGMEPYQMVLSNEDQQSARTMAEGREGYARLVSQVATANENSLPREYAAADLSDRLNYDSRLEEVRQLLLKLGELVSETQSVNGVNIMRLVDIFAGTLQLSRKGNTALDTAMGEIDEWNRRFANKPKTTTPDTPADPNTPGNIDNGENGSGGQN